MDYRGLLYSAYDEMTVSSLKKGNYEKDYDVENVENRMKKNDVHVSVLGSDFYHFKFHRVRSQPFLYYWWGDLDVLNYPLLAVVGPRKMSQYASQVVSKLFEELRHYDVATISGLAPGVDSLCHELSIVNKIPTVAVLGMGLAYAKRQSKRHQLKKIVENGGLLISEFKLKQKAAPYTFPQRNRLIAGLAQCVFLPEAGKNSGSLITVDDACAVSTPVYGTPQNIFVLQSSGLLSYMQEGKVSVVYDIKMFLENEFASFRKNKKQQNSQDYSSIQLTDEQCLLIKILQESNNPLSVDELLDKSSLRLDAMMSSLTLLEISSLLQQNDQGSYFLC